MTRTGGSGPVGPPWIAAVLEPGLVRSASRLGWGFSNETWKIVLADGRRLAVTRLGQADAAPTVAALSAMIRPRLLAVGVPVPAVVDLGLAPEAGILVTDFIDGTPGSEVLDREGGPALVGSLLGDAWRRLSAVDPSGLPLPAAWTDAAGLAAASSARLDGAAPWLTNRERGRLVADIRELPHLLDERQPGFVHGDLVPVNVLVHERALAALLDFEFARLADRLLDASWFRWIVAFHHPEREPTAWGAFVDSSGLDGDDPSSRALLRLLPLIRILEILDDERLTTDGAAHWTRMLRACLGQWG
jgi:aminoglycoside phosphotransferase (APT) family kinase protein